MLNDTIIPGAVFLIICLAIYAWGIGSFPWHELKGGDNNDLNTRIK